MTESAIPKHLEAERTQPSLAKDGYVPPYDAYCARFSDKTKDLAMAVIGAQFSSAEKHRSHDAMSTITSFMTACPARPSFSELAAVNDSLGFYNIAVIAYWPSRSEYTRWAEESGFQKWWNEIDPEMEPHGWFSEVFFPTVDRFETIFTDNEVPEGAAHMREKVSCPIREHGYWGSMRDRMPASQVDSLTGDPAICKIAPLYKGSKPYPVRTAIAGQKNLCVIRSGEDWLDALPEERELYTTTLHPVLVKGMDFLRDHGEEVGCVSCRFMDVVDPSTQKADKDRTFGLAYFDDIASLEKWSREHPTHLNIFGGFMRYAKELDSNITVRFFHEVMVLKPEQQRFEYITCHLMTGMLRLLCDGPIRR